MNLRIAPVWALKGEISLPGDKSISHRAAILAALARGESLIKGYLEAEDTLHTLKTLELLGVEVEKKSPGKYLIRGRGLKGLKEPQDVIDCGNSGTLMRLLAGLLAGQPFYSVLSGDASLRQRPMARIIHPLSQMGASFWSREGGYAPLSIKGAKLSGLDYTLPIASAQLKSAILLAGLYSRDGVRIIEPIPSRNHSEKLLQFMGAKIKTSGRLIELQGNSELRGCQLEIPGDLSAAAFFLAAGLMVPDSEIILRNVGINFTRSGILEVLAKMGAQCQVIPRGLLGLEPIGDIIVKSSSLQGVRIQGELIPRLIDEIPVLAVVATQAYGDTLIRDAGELRVKESDRIANLVKELQKLGVKIKEYADGMMISGPVKLKGNVVLDSHGDHRLAMALAVAGLAAKDEVIIENAEALNTSFPEFLNVLQSL